MAMLLNSFLVVPGFQPDDITGLKLWLDAQDGTTITFGTGSNVQDWVDKAPGATLTFQQLIGSRQPLAVQINGRQMIEFDGVDEYISHPDNARYDFAGDFELHVVYRTADTDRGDMIAKGSAIRWHIRVNNQAPTDDLTAAIDDDTTAAIIEDTSENWNDDTVRIAGMVRDGNNLRQFEDFNETPSSPIDITGYGSLENAGIVFVGSFDEQQQLFRRRDRRDRDV